MAEKQGPVSWDAFAGRLEDRLRPWRTVTSWENAESAAQPRAQDAPCVSLALSAGKALLPSAAIQATGLSAGGGEALPERYAANRIHRASSTADLLLKVRAEPTVLGSDAVHTVMPSRPNVMVGPSVAKVPFLPSWRNPVYPLPSYGGAVQKRLLTATQKDIAEWLIRPRHQPNGVHPSLAVALKNTLRFDPQSTNFPLGDSVLEQCFSRWAHRTLKPVFPAKVGGIGGRLHRFWREWRRRGYPEYIWGKLRFGFVPNLHVPGEVPARPKKLPRALITDPAQQAAVAVEFQRLEREGIVHLELDPTTGRRMIYSNLPGGNNDPWRTDPVTGRAERFCTNILGVPKKNGNIRVCFNGKPLNIKVNRRKRKMPSISQFRQAFRANMYYMTVDLQDWYCHLPLSQFAKKLFHALVPIPGKPGQFWLAQYLAAIFGYSEAGDWAQDVVTAVLSKFRQDTGAFAAGQMDDVAIGARTRRNCYKRFQEFINEAHALGIVMHPPKPGKTNPFPNPIFQHLGRVWSSRTMIESSAAKDFAKLKRAAAHCLARAKKGLAPNTRSLQSLAGLLNWEQSANTMARLVAHRLRHFITRQMRPLHAGNRPFPKALCDDLQFMGDKLRRWNGRVLLSCSPHVVAATDASDFGKGIALFAPGDSNRRAVAYRQMLKAGRRLTDPIDEKEAEAITADLRAIIELNNFRCINMLLLQDNQVVLSYLLKEGGRHRRLADKIVAFLRWAQEERHIFFSATYIASGDNWVADTESRRQHAVPRINPLVFRQAIETRFGKIDVDTMATETNAQVPTYFSWKPELKAAAIDFFQQDLDAFNNPYVNPPTPLIPRVLRFLEEKAVQQAVVVVPVWPTRPWWPHWIETLIELPIILPQETAHEWDVDARKTTSETLPPPARTWLTCVGRCSGKPGAAAALRDRLRAKSKQRSTTDTTTVWENSILNFCDSGASSAATAKAAASSILRMLLSCDF